MDYRRRNFAGWPSTARAHAVWAASAIALLVGCTGAVLEPGSEGEEATPGAGKSGNGRGNGPNGTGGSSSSSAPGAGNGNGSAGEAPDPPSPGPDPTAPVTCDDSKIQIGSAPMRRLSNAEYLRTVADLFPGSSPELPVLPIEDPVDAFDNDARALGPSDVAVTRWEEVAFRYTRDLTANAASLSSFLPCAKGASDVTSQKACGTQLIDGFGLKTHRRPLTADEKKRYQTLFDEQLAAIDFQAAVQLTAMAMLQAPAFLYRLEIPSGAAKDGTVPLDSWQMASRLSYFLWQRMPDQELFDAAKADELTDAAEIERQARRMLADERAADALADFHRQWLFFDRMKREEHDSRVPDVSKDWNAATQAAAHEELLRFVKLTLFSKQGTLADLFLSRDAEVDASLAKIYGVRAPAQAGQWASVTLPEAERAGILTRVGFLAAHAHSANGSPPLRGAYVMQRLFCLKPGAPPPGADTSPPEIQGTNRTNRELFEERSAPADCQGCHVTMDAFGFGFEHYDAIGAYRDEDNGKPVNARVTLVGTDVTGEVDGAIELSEKLARSEQVAQCAVSRWFRYSRGRGLEGVDQCTLNRLHARFAASGGDIASLLVDLALSADFRNRPATQE